MQREIESIVYLEGISQVMEQNTKRIAKQEEEIKKLKHHIRYLYLFMFIFVVIIILILKVAIWEL